MNMKEKKVQSATILNLIIGVVYGLVLVFGIASLSVYFYEHKSELLIAPILLIPMGLLSLVGYSMITSYRNRKEFIIYEIEKKGIIDFDLIEETYTQVEDICGKLFFVKKENYCLYSDFKLLGKISWN